MKVIITGATGMVGKGVLLECLDHPKVDEVLVISRRPLELPHKKLRELIHQDFSDFSQVEELLQGYDACYHCMGVSAAGMNEATYTRMTYDFTMALAEPLKKLNPGMTFIYVSGQGTDSSESGRTMWARVKGRTENAIFNLGFQQAFAFRPGAIIPKRGVTPSSKLYRTLITNLSWLIKLLKRAFPTAIVDSIEIGKAMIQATLYGYEKKIIDPADIIILSTKDKA